MSRRVVVLAGSAALTWACASTSNRRTAPTARRPGRGSDPSTSTPAHDPDWVRTESAHSGTTAWRIPAARLAAEEDLAGDADRASVLTGQPVGLHLSNTLGPVTLMAYRLGYCVPITLRPADATDRLVLVSAVTSCQAYDKWGCSSLYKAHDGSFATRARAVSFDRPYDRRGASHVLNHDIGPIRLAESVGLDLDYRTSWNLHDQPHVLALARGVVRLGPTLRSNGRGPTREGPSRSGNLDWIGASPMTSTRTGGPVAFA